MVMNVRTVLGCLTVVALLAGCGGEPAAPAGCREPAAGGSRLDGQEQLARTRQRRGGEAQLPDVAQASGQGAGQRLSPCSLVTQAQAGAILGGAVRLPAEAPQGPTCIYRTAKGDGFVSLSVQTSDFARAKRKLREATKVDLGSCTGLCGRYGRPTL